MRILQFVSIACFLALLALCLLTSQLPRTTGQVELLFPNSSVTKEWLYIEREVFESVYTDSIVLSAGLDSERFFEIERLSENLLELYGIVDVLYPQSNGGQDIFGLISDSTQQVRIIVKVDSALSDSERQNLNAEIKSVLKKFQHLRPRRAGVFVTMQDVGDLISSETLRLVPWIIGVLALIVLIFLRSVAVTLTVLLSTLLGLAICVLSYSLLGLALGPVSQLAPPFLLAVGSSFHLHVVTRLLSVPLDSWSDTLRELRFGILLAAGTTSVSLASLLWLGIPDVSSFALLSSLGTVVMAWQATVFQVAFIKTLRSKVVPVVSDNISRAFFSLSHWVSLTVAVSLATFLALGIPFLQVHTDPLTFLPASHKTLKAVQELEDTFPGNHFVSLLFKADKGVHVPEGFEFLASLKDKVRELPGVVRVISPHDFELYLSERAGADMLKAFTLNESVVPPSFFAPADSLFRVIVETSKEGRDLLSLRKSIGQIISSDSELDRFGGGITSFELIMAEQTESIVKSLIQSLALVFIFVAVLLLLIFGSPKIALVGLVPNLIPVVCVFGLIGLSGQALDFGSCLVATSALGVAVDNTFHLLLCWRTKRLEIGDSFRAAQETVITTAAPFCITSCALIVSFATMLLARSLPVAHFGGLLAVTLFVGLFADLVILPLLLTNGKSLRS